MPGRTVIQWDKEDCADLRLIKIDLLGLGMMAVLEDCLKLIRNHWREEIDLGRLPADDPKQRQPEISKARKQLGWEPTIPLRDGLQRTIDYFRPLIGSPRMKSRAQKLVG